MPCSIVKKIFHENLRNTLAIKRLSVKIRKESKKETELFLTSCTIYLPVTTNIYGMYNTYIIFPKEEILKPICRELAW